MNASIVNKRFKAKYGKYFTVGVVLSILFHLGLIIYTPEFSIAKIRVTDEPFQVIDIPPEIVIPPQPARDLFSVISFAVSSVFYSWNPN